MKPLIIFVLCAMSLREASGFFCSYFNQTKKLYAYHCEMYGGPISQECEHSKRERPVRPLDVNILRMGGCNRDDITYAIQLCSNLTELDISHSRFKNLDAINIGHERIETIIASFNGLLSEPWTTYQTILERYPGLTTLDLAHNNLKFINSFALRGVVNLKTINLSFNKIEYLNDDAFANFTKLENVNLSNNHINLTFASVFSNLIRLKTLNLEKNPITQFDCDDLLESKELLSVYLTWNNVQRLNTDCADAQFRGQLTSKMEGIRPFEHRTFTIYCMSTTFENTTHFLAGSNRLANGLGITQCFGAKLEELDLSGNSLKQIHETAFDDLANLTVLSLKATNLSMFDVNVLVNLKKLRILDISSNNLKSVTNVSLLMTLESLTELNLAGNHLNNVWNVLQHLPASLTTLDLSDNYAGRINATMFEGAKNLIHLKLSNTHLSIVDLSAFEQLLNLQNLDISNNNLTGKDIHFGSATIKMLDFSRNHLGQITATTFEGLENIRALKLNDTNLTISEANPFNGLARLLALDLSNNNLKELNFSMMAPTLRFLVGLNIAHCHIDNVTQVIGYLGRKLYALDVSGNNVGELNADKLKTITNLYFLNANNANVTQFAPDTLRNLKHLQSLQLAHNKIRQINFQQSPATLRKLDLRANDLTNIKNLNRKQFPVLERLSITKNRLEHHDVAQIKRDLEEGHVFHSRKLFDNDFPWDQRD